MPSVFSGYCGRALTRCAGPANRVETMQQRVRTPTRSLAMRGLSGLASTTLLVFLLATPWFSLAQKAQPADANAPSLPLYPRSTADFDQMRKHRLVRILVPYSKTIYFIDKGAERGTAAEGGRQLEKWLNK